MNDDEAKNSRGASNSRVASSASDGTSESDAHRLTAFHDQCDAYEQQWQSGGDPPPNLSDFILGWAEPQLTLLLRELLIIDIRYRQRNELTVDARDYCQRFSRHENTIRDVLVQLGVSSPAETHAVQPTQNVTGDPLALAAVHATLDNPGGAVEDAPRIDRYAFRKVLGEGGFGRVYLAVDRQLQREVAIKIPRVDNGSPGHVEAYLNEARVVASFSHPSVASVFDFGQTENGQCFVVSQFIDGMDLAKKIKSDRPTPAESARLIATIAEGLNEAHRKKLVHRDIKPANILLNNEGQPFLTDFGLALREDSYGKHGAFAGTPAYMSPEQARGEGHLVDGRSDLFSLGIVFFELLTGERPFTGDTTSEVLDRIKYVDARPPRQLDHCLPRELERICLKCISKRTADRYTTAIDLANDLYVFLADQDERIAEADLVDARESNDARHPVVPKGLRSFGAEDSDFFLQLIPGATDRTGIPESIRFWKNRIEETDADSSFRVGFIYGPSGCGKSSFVKAGLMPRLASHVSVCFVECHSGQTETRLKRRLQHIASDLPHDLEIDAIVAEIRTHRQHAGHRKVLIVLDQFEQWLHAHQRFCDQPLVRALRQCDSTHVQCLALVRDDFWLAVHRLSRELEIDLALDKNIAVVDLLNETDARRVLAEFGRGYRRLPDGTRSLSSEQEAFLDTAIEGLSQEGKIIPIHLALFAEMTKDKVWSPNKLTTAGGVRGVGAAFLQSSFDASGIPPSHRLHRHAAQCVLKELLPEATTSIRGTMRSRRELMEAAGYASRPRDFDDLMRVLDNDLRLLTPTDVDEHSSDDETKIGTHEPSYQLTHDFLVPSVREWLLQKQRQTRTGRATILVNERAAFWNSQRSSRNLPSLIELASILTFTSRHRWTERERQMVGHAKRYYGVRCAVVAACVLLTIGGVVLQRSEHANRLVGLLRTADIGQVPVIAEQLKAYPFVSRTKLIEMANDDTDIGAQLRARTAHAAAFETEARLDIENEKRLWDLLDNERDDADDRFRAACILARHGAASGAEGTGRWSQHASFVAEQQIAAIDASPTDVNIWSNLLLNARKPLFEPLRNIFASDNRTQVERRFAAVVLSRYFETDPDVLAGLLQDSEPAQFESVMAKLVKHKSASAHLRKRFVAASNKMQTNRIATSAIALHQLGDNAPVLALLPRSNCPDVRTAVIFLAIEIFKENDFDQFSLLLDRQKDPGIRQSVLQIVGAVPDRLSPDVKSRIIEIATHYFASERDPGLRGTAGWLLRKWDQADRVIQLENELATGVESPDRGWYVTNTQRHTMVILGPDTFRMGTPADDTRRRPDETAMEQRIDHRFAISDKEVTIAQVDEYAREVWSTNYHDEYIKRKTQDNKYDEQQLELLKTSIRKYGSADDAPRNFVDFVIVARYCNWLSEREGVAPYYKIDSHARTIENGGHGSPGYRLPNESEWEYACRAGTTSARYFGDSDRIAEKYLRHYAWYNDTSSDRPWPAGALLPNDFGIFDMLGNVSEMCNIDDNRSNDRIARGSSFAHLVELARSAAVFEKQNVGSPNLGFRIARTLPSRPRE